MAMECVTIKGAPFEVGQALGRIGKPAAGLIAAAVAQEAASSPPGKTAALLEQVRDRFPCYWDELRGMSDGLGLDMADVFLWNCRQDMAGASRMASSSVVIHRLGYGLILHSLRLGPALAVHCKLADVRPDGSPGFLGLYVPGCLPGAAFAANHAGVAQAVNHIVGEEPGAGLPSFIISRAVLDACSLADAVDIVMACERYGAAHHVLASTNEFVMLGITATPSGCSLIPISNKYWQTNHAGKGMAGDGTAAGESSRRRHASLGVLMARMPAHPGEEDILPLLESGAVPAGSCAEASEIRPAEGEIGTALLKVVPEGIHLRLFRYGQAESRSYVVGMG